MSKINDGGQAFPRSGFYNDNGHYDNAPNEGMTLRDYIAVHTLPALLQSTLESAPKGASIEEALKLVAEYSYVAAEAMIAAREVKS